MWYFLMFADKLLGKFMFVYCRYDSAFTDLTKHILNEDFIQPTNTNFDMDAYALDKTIKKNLSELLETFLCLT